MKQKSGPWIAVRTVLGLFLLVAVSPLSIRAGEMTVNTYSPPFQAQLVGINDRGEILGVWSYGGVIYNPADSVVVPFPGPGAIAINNRGQVLFGLGIYNYGSDHTVTSLGDLWKAREAAGKGAAAGTLFPVNLTGFNDLGQFIGENTRSDGKFGMYSTAVTASPGAKDTSATLGEFVEIKCPGHSRVHPTALNNRGQIVGTVGQLGAQDQQAFLYNIADGTATYFSYPGAMWTEPKGINDAGLIVGIYQEKGGRTQGFTYDGSRFTQIVAFVAESTQGKGHFPHIASGINNHGDIVGSISGTRSSFIAMAGGRPPPLVSGFVPRPGNYERDNPRTRMTGANRAVSPASAPTAAPEADPNFVFSPYPSFDRLDAFYIIKWTYANTGRDPTIPQVIFPDNNDDKYLGFNALGSWFYGQVDGWVYVYNRKERWVHAITAYVDELPASLSNSSDYFLELRRRAERASISAPDPAASSSGSVGATAANQGPGELGNSNSPAAGLAGSSTLPQAPKSEAARLMRGKEAAVTNGVLTFTIDDNASPENGKKATYKAARFNSSVALTNPNMPKPANPDAGVWIGADPADENKIVMFNVKDDRTITGQPVSGMQAAIMKRIMETSAQSQK